MNDADKAREKCTGSNMLEMRRHKQKMSEQSILLTFSWNPLSSLCIWPNHFTVAYLLLSVLSSTAVTSPVRWDP